MYGVCTIVDINPVSLQMRILITTLVLCGWLPLVAQVDSRQSADELSKVALAKQDSIAWKLKGTFGAGFTTVQLNNWAGGGQNSVAIRGLFLGTADYTDSLFAWDNDVDLGYGLIKLGSESFRKADDRIILTSKASHGISSTIRATGLLDFRTQFAEGLNYDKRDTFGNFVKISNLFAPAFITAGIGAEWKPLPEFTVLVAPLSGRLIVVADDDLNAVGAFGVNPGSTTKLDVGTLINATVDWEFVKNVRWKSRLNMFGRYEQIQLWVVTLENAFLLSVNEFLSVGILTDVFYDDRVALTRDNGTLGPATQFRNQLLINFTWSVANH
jgi:hypothetical protein